MKEVGQIFLYSIDKNFVYLFPNILLIMRKELILFLAMIFSVACASQPKRSGDSVVRVAAPEQWGYSVQATYPHPVDSYTQGLQYVDGKLWEGTGLEGQSRLQTIDLATGEVQVLAHLPKQQFGEGITVLGDKVYQLTWTDRKVHVYDREGNRLRSVTRSGEGWGLTTDGEWLYLSDGSDKIFKVNPETLRNESYISVKRAGEAVDFLNELEWIDGKIWANIYLSDEIVVINPATGVVEAVMDFQGLLPESERDVNTDVLNGIAYDQEQRRILLTGKRWSKIYHIEVVK